MKPPYVVPTMEEVRQIPWNGYQVVSLFAGAGGSSTGYRLAGFKVIYANEFIPKAYESYYKNYPDTILDIRDIRMIPVESILEQTGLQVGELDILDGSPPCAVFSMASAQKRKEVSKVKEYSGVKQRLDDLFDHYIRILEGLKPKVFVAENVPGLAKGVNKPLFQRIVRKMKACGYQVKVGLIDAQYCGVPQRRKRLIFLGVRSDLEIEPVFPKPLPYSYTVKEVCPQIKRIKFGRFHDNWQTSEQVAATIMQSDGRRRNETAILSSYLVEDEEGNVRKYQINELKRIHSIPPDYVLTGDFGDQWERIGRSVPPFMMKRIAETVRDEMLCKV